MTAQNFIPKPYTKTIENGSVTWQAPSNIALVKYWGKKENQIPANPSISFTLSGCNTKTTLTYSKKDTNNTFSFDVYLSGEKQDSFKPKIETFFKRIEIYMPFLKDFHFKIETENTFPHSSGIASSASGMSALALCLMDLERLLSDAEISNNYFGQKASFLARLGSGSACRSIEGSLVAWGEHHDISESSNLFGVKYPFEVHDNFKDYQDTILLVDKGEKQVSSSVGHGLMHNHPFAEQRFKQAHQNLSALITIFKTGNLEAFIKIVESEALTLHAMMMTSMPYFILMKPNTLEIINKIWTYRSSTGSKLCFTLDAGANVHLLYPVNEKQEVLEFINNELVVYCQNGHYICDQIGLGANKID
ncbi:diphosphomevalonate decarboxylase [Seonamhaeicola algicola]|uniref:Diphosphomevalonate decarboxylase n=1 Tax=Seonamhaeicola algicola TaxID=1719036 RepID=A0A5C7AMA6_9FLAO|nr:diphosphomevalonate decarboxylase [Seonamhaeicola algicola]TXE09738.1 diphosphomevalonate decarboxylase [Seonamhaeicola algicola]